jgi:protein-S-isoprenylcysteine O-methyltransferase Ste14
MRQLLLPPITFLLAVAAMVLLDQYTPVAELRGYSVHWSGLILVLMGLAITVSHARMFARLKTEINTFRPPGTLVKDGLYKHSRNPMYCGFVLSLLGAAIFLGSAAAFLPLVAFFLLASFWYIPFEEINMRKNFGAEFESYAKTVRRWM